MVTKKNQSRSYLNHLVVFNMLNRFVFMCNIVNYVCWIVKVRFLFHFVPCYLLYFHECSLVGSNTLVLNAVKDLSFLNTLYELSVCRKNFRNI